jgi:hypothetical protein
MVLYLVGIFFLFSESAKFSAAVSRQSMTNEEFIELREIANNADIPKELLVATRHSVVGDAVGEWLASFKDKRSPLLHQLSEWNGDYGKRIEAQFRIEACCTDPGPTCASEIREMTPSLVLLIHKPSCSLLQDYLYRSGMAKELVASSHFSVISGL